MGLLLAFAPFIVFVIVERLVDTKIALISAAAVSAILLARDALSRERTVKVLEIGTILLFGGLAAIAMITDASWSIAAVRLRVDAGLLLVVLISIAIRKPFTIQYAREQTPPDVWGQPEFARVNYVITAVWAAAFAVMVAADLALVYVPALPVKVSVIVTLAALYGAIKFTAWYPERGQAIKSR